MTKKKLSSALVPDSKKVVLKSGEAITVGQFNTFQTLDSLASIYAIIEAIEKAGGEATVPQLLRSAPAAVLDLVAVGAGKASNDIGLLPPTDTLALAAAVIEVNYPFFVAEVLPALGNLARAINPAPASA